MASFTESATLLLKDKASKDINKVNASLRKLFETATKMKKTKLGVNIDTSSIAKANQLATAIKNLNTASRSASNRRIGPTVNTAAVAQAKQLATALRNLDIAQKGMSNRRIASPVAAGDATKVRNLMNSLQQYNKLLNRLSARAGGVLPVPTVDMGKVGNIKQATAALKAYVTTLGMVPRGGGRLPVPAAPPGGAGAKSAGVAGVDPREWGNRFGTGFLTTATHTFAYAIQAAVVAGIKEGTKQIDVGESQLGQLGAKSEQVSAIADMVRRVSAKTEGRITEGRLFGQAAELFPDVSHLPIASFEVILSELARAQSAMIESGSSAEEASKGAASFVKAMTSSNMVFDEAGNVQKGFADNMTYMIESMAGGGVESRANKMADYIRNMGAAGKYADPETRQLVLFLGEDIGTKAAKGFNQLQRQIFGGRTTPKTKEALKDLGLVNKKGQVVDRETGKPIDKNAPDFNMVQWTKEQLTPAITASLEKQGKVASEKNIYDELLKIGLSTSGEEAMAGIVTQIKEFERRQALYQKMDTSQEAINARLETALVANVNRVSEQFTGMLGAITDSFEGILNPALTAAASALNSITQWIAPRPGEGEVTAGEAAAGLAVGAAGVGGAVGLSKLVMGLLNPFSTSAKTLTAAGTQLQAAAAALTRAAGGTPVPGTPGATGGGKAGKAVGGAAVGAALGGAVTGAVTGDWAAAGDAAAGAFILGLAGSVFGPGGTAAGATIGSSIGAAFGKEIRGFIASIGSAIADAVGSTAVGKWLMETGGAVVDSMTGLDASEAADEKRKQAASAKRRVLEAGDPRKLKLAKAEEDMAAMLADDAASAAGGVAALHAQIVKLKTELGMIAVAKPLDEKPATTAAPKGDRVQPAAERFGKAATEAAPVDPARFGAEAAMPIDLAFTQGSGTFATVLTTGAQGITAAGASAADAFAGRAPGIGTIIGNSAAAAIASAVSNLNVNVNANVTQSGSGVDAGSQAVQ